MVLTQCLLLSMGWPRLYAQPFCRQTSEALGLEVGSHSLEVDTVDLSICLCENEARAAVRGVNSWMRNMAQLARVLAQHT